MKLLCLCDWAQTGFGRVSANLLPRWSSEDRSLPAAPFFSQIDIWGINYSGTPHDTPFRIWPANCYPSPDSSGWNRPQCLGEFLNRLATGDYTHVWLMQDLFALSVGNFPQHLKHVCDARGIVSSLYFPVDAPVRPDWCRIIEAVDYPVAYTEYGARQVLSKMSEGSKLAHIIPHGVDTSIYHPTGRKTALREALFSKGFVRQGDFLIINSNMNQKRKDILRTMLIVQELRRRGLSVKLLLNMTEKSMDDSHMEQWAEQMNFKRGVEWDHMDKYFHNGFPRITEDGLNDLYNAADLYLTTTLGEGFGLGMVEALAAGCPVAVPKHTACEEIANALDSLGMDGQIVKLPIEQFPIALPHDHSRLRYQVNVELAADAIIQNMRDFRYGDRLEPAAMAWLDWDRIASEFIIEVFSRPKPAGSPLYMEMGGGLGDVFHQYISRGYYQLLEDLRPNQQATVTIVCHNPAAKEILAAHPKRSQIKVLDLGYWTPADDQKMRIVHGLPANPQAPLLPAHLGPPKFYPLESDQPILSEMASRPAYLLFALSAGTSIRTFPHAIAAWCLDAAMRENWDILWTGRDYQRDADKEQVHSELLPQDLGIDYPPEKVVNAINRLSAPGTALMVQQCAGIITSHSALSLLGWHFDKPMLLLYPQSALDEHIKRRDQWSFGIDRPNTIHALFDAYTPELLEKFFKLL